MGLIGSENAAESHAQARPTLQSGLSADPLEPIYAITWNRFDGGSWDAGFEHLYPMVYVAPGGGFNAIMEGLQRLPEGRRALVMAFPHNCVWGNPDDRVQDATGAIIGAPVPGNCEYMFRGGDVGYSSPWPDAFVRTYKPWADSLARAIKAAGIEVDHLIFDVESKLDEFKVGTVWRAALMLDPRWPQAQARLNELKRERTGDMTAVVNFGADDVYHDGGDLDWDAYMWEQQAKALNEALFDPFKAVFPGLTGSNYEHHGRNVHDSAPDLNTHLYYQTMVTGTHASDYHYGWLNQSEPVYGGSGFKVFKYEQQRTRSSIRAGYGIQPWIAYDGFDDSDWDDVYAPQKGYDSSPYWAENIRHLALLGADPILYWNSRTYEDDSGTSATNAKDALVDGILSEINDVIGLDAPRYPVTTEELPWTVSSGSDLVATGIRYGGKVLWRVTIQRIGSVSPEIDIPVYNGGTSTGESVTIPAGEVGAYYVSDWFEGIENSIRFDFQHPALPNLIPQDGGFGSGLWAVGDEGTLTEGAEDPLGSNAGYLLEHDFLLSPAIPVEANKVYTASLYARRASPSGVFNTRFRILGSDGATEIESTGIKMIGGEEWVRHEVRFNSGNNQQVYIRFGQSGSSFDAHVYGAYLNEGAVASPYGDGPTPTGARQRIDLEEGCSIVAPTVQFADARLESIFSSIVASVLVVRDEAGRVYDPEKGINEIGTWKAGEAYVVCTDEPASLDVNGTATKQSTSVALREGWNLIPYGGSQPLLVKDAISSIASSAVMVRSDTGEIYYPSRSINTLDVLEPGEGYWLYMSSAGTLTYPAP